MYALPKSAPPLPPTNTQGLTVIPSTSSHKHTRSEKGRIFLGSVDFVNHAVQENVVKYLRKIYRRPAEGCEQANLQIVQGRAPTEIFLQEREKLKIHHRNEASQKDGRGYRRAPCLPSSAGNSACREVRVKPRGRNKEQRKEVVY